MQQVRRRVVRTAPEKKELMMPVGEELLLLTHQPRFLTPSTSLTRAPGLASAPCSSRPSTSWPAPACMPPLMRTTCSTHLSLTPRPRRPPRTMSPRAPQHEQRPPRWVSVVQHLEPHPSLFRLGWVRVRACWYARRDSNPHARRHQDLNLGRLPIPPLALCRAYSTDFCADGRTRRPLGRALVDRAWAQEDPRERLRDALSPHQVW